MTGASNSRPSQSWTRNRAPRATWALVTTVPSPDQITPEPLPRPPAVIRTVERPSCSAISPNPETAILFIPVLSFADYDAGLLRGAAANELQRERFANDRTVKLGVHVFQASDRTTG